MENNSANWFFNYACQEHYIHSAHWCTNFRIPYPFFYELVCDIGHNMERLNTNMRFSIRPEVKIAAFLCTLGAVPTLRRLISLVLA